MSKEHAAARRILDVAVQYLSELRPMSRQRPVVTDHIDRLCIFGRHERFLYHGPAWANNETVAVPVRERPQTGEVVLDRRWGSTSRQRDLFAKRRDRDQVPLASLSVTQNDRGHLRLACFRGRCFLVSINELRQFSRGSLRDMDVVKLKALSLLLWLGRLLSNCYCSSRQ